MQDLKSRCRLCASDGIHKIDIFLIENKSSIADDLNQLCNLKLENKMELPTKICEQCAISIKNLKKFLLNSIKTQKLLTELLSNEINNSIDHEIKQEEDDLSSSNTENVLIETWFSEDELIEENGIKEKISSKNIPKKSNIIQDKNLFNEEKDEISDRLKEKEKDILEDLSLREIKGKINKKRCKTSNKKKEKQHLGNDKNSFGERSDGISDRLKEKDILEDLSLRELKEKINKKRCKTNNLKKKKQLVENDKNSFGQSIDELSGDLEESKKDIPEDLSLREIKEKINKKRCKTNSLKKEKQLLENDKKSFGKRSDELSGDLEESKKDILEDLSLREIKGNINKKSYKSNNSKKEKSQLENNKNLIKDISKSSELLMIEEIEKKKDSSPKNIPHKNSEIFDKNSFSGKNDEIFDSLEVSEDLPLSEIKRKINKRRCKINDLKKEKQDLENDKNLIKDISIISKKKRVRSSKKQSTKLQCKLCEKSYKKEAGLTHHLRLTHSIKKDPYPCKFCGKLFSTTQALVEHEYTHLPLEERPLTACPHCDKKFHSVSGRWTHIRAIHGDRKRIVCEECGKSFPTVSYLLRHKESHIEEKKIPCPHCDAKFKSKNAVTAHMRSHGESHPCLECGLHLKTKALLKDHMVIHSDVRNFKCNFCNNDFKRMRDLKYHIIRKHMKINPFECRVCRQRFPIDKTNNNHCKVKHPKEFKEMMAKKECLSTRHFPPLKQILDLNEAAKSKNFWIDTDENIVENSEEAAKSKNINAEKTDENIVENSEEAAKSKNINVEKTDENIVENSEVQS